MRANASVITNVNWKLDGKQMSEALGIPHLRFVYPFVAPSTDAVLLICTFHTKVLRASPSFAPRTFDLTRHHPCRLINDFVGVGYGLLALEMEDVHVLNGIAPCAEAPKACVGQWFPKFTVIAIKRSFVESITIHPPNVHPSSEIGAGTGLGETYLTWFVHTAVAESVTQSASGTSSEFRASIEPYAPQLGTEGNMTCGRPKEDTGACCHECSINYIL